MSSECCPPCPPILSLTISLPSHIMLVVNPCSPLISSDDDDDDDDDGVCGGVCMCDDVCV